MSINLQLKLWWIFTGIFLNDIWDCYLGIDIGVKSTKAVYYRFRKGDVIPGLYTRTSGRPLGGSAVLV
jgi:activator of 2-hydroxyglutaryl-CoA dehydratase